MQLAQRYSLPFLACLLLFSQTPVRAATIITFDGLADGAIVTNQFPGLNFSNTIALTAGISLNEFEFPPRSGLNVASDNGGPITISFTSAVSSFGGYFTYLVPLTLQAFNAGNTQVGQAISLFGSNLALSGDPGSSPNELLQVNFASGISKVTITGDPAGVSFSLDDATITSLPIQGVPEPSTISSLLTSMLVFLAYNTVYKKL